MNKSLYCFYALTPKCNRSCSYCLGGKNKKTNGGMGGGMLVSYKCVAHKLKSLDLPIQIDLSGGEPTFRSDFDEVVDYLITNIPKLTRIILSTNGNLNYNFLKLEKFAERVNFLLSITIHLENFNNQLIENIKHIIKQNMKNINIELRIAFLPQKKDLVLKIVDELDSVRVYKKLLLFLYDDNIHYDADTLTLINKINSRWNFFETQLPAFCGTYCVSSGIAILHNGIYARCCSGKNFVTKSKVPIFAEINEKILIPEIIKCRLKHCVTHSECHKNFQTLSEAEQFVKNFKYEK